MNPYLKLFFFILMIRSAFLHADNQVNYNPLLAQHVMEKQLLKEEGFCLFDVGASGGFHSRWNVFGKSLRGFGFDPLVKECETLNADNTFPGFRYVSCYVISEIEEVDTFANDPPSLWYGRSSALSMSEILKVNYAQEVFNRGEEVVLSKEKMSLDTFCEKQKIHHVDFVKIDTDGYDYCVLRGADKLLSQVETLGALVETNYNGTLHPYSNCFRNVDAFLVEKEFCLFDLSVNRYAKKDLPSRFVYKIPAQTVSGQASWGDLLYLRDFVAMKKEGKSIGTRQVLKMACIMEIFGLTDCAAELLITFKSQLSPVINVDHCLDLLAKEMNLFTSYQEHISEFQKDPTQFYPIPQ